MSPYAYLPILEHFHPPLQGVHAWNAGVYDGGHYDWKHGVGIAVTAHQNRIVACYLDYSSLAVTDPNELVVEASMFLGVPAVFISNTSTTLQGISWHGNTFNTGGECSLKLKCYRGMLCESCMLISVT